MKNFKFLSLALFLGLSSQIFSMNKLLQKASAAALTSVRTVHSCTSADKWTRYVIVSKKRECFDSPQFTESPTPTEKYKGVKYFQAGVSSDLKKRYHSKHPHLRIKNIQHTEDTTNIEMGINTRKCVVKYVPGILTATHDASIMYEIQGVDTVYEKVLLLEREYVF